MAFKTQFPFRLPRGYVDESGNVHRDGVMRLATARDEILPLQDYRVQSNRAYLVIVLLSRVIVKIGSLPCDRVASVDSFTWKTSVTADQIGITREPTFHAAKVVVPDVKLSISAADHKDWSDAAKKWFVDGHHLDADEMQGAITFLGPDMKTEYGEVSLKNIGFKKFSEEDKEANAEKISRFNVELYIEEMEFKMKETDK